MLSALCCFRSHPGYVTRPILAVGTGLVISCLSQSPNLDVGPALVDTWAPPELSPYFSLSFLFRSLKALPFPTIFLNLLIIHFQLLIRFISFLANQPHCYSEHSKIVGLKHLPPQRYIKNWKLCMPGLLIFHASMKKPGMSSCTEMCVITNVIIML